MNLKRRLLGWVLAGALVPLSVGCSGINASHSVSPASFFLPGLMGQPETPKSAKPPGDPSAEPDPLLAQAN